MFRQAFEDLGNLRRSLARAEHHFGHSHAQIAVMVYLGEAQVFEGKVPELFDSVIGGELAAPHLLEQSAD